MFNVQSAEAILFVSAICAVSSSSFQLTRLEDDEAEVDPSETFFGDTTTAFTARLPSYW